MGRQKSVVNNNPKNQCEYCGKEFGQISHLYRHVRNVHEINIYHRNPVSDKDAIFQCNHCPKAFTCRNSLYRHRVATHGKIERKPSKKIKLPPKCLDPLSNEEINQILSTFPNDDDCKYHYRVIKSATTLIKVEFSIGNVREAIKWKERYEEKNKIFVRKHRTNKSKKDFVLYKQRFHCGHFIESSKSKHGERHTNCPFRLHIVVKERDSSLTAWVQLTGMHNHEIGCAESLKFRPVSEQVREKFLSLFSRNYTAAKALRTHVKDLEEEYGDEFYKIQGDRFYIPDINWVHRLHDTVYKKKYKFQYGLSMLENLNEKVEEFQYAKLKVIDEDFNYVVSIVTPFMMRIHEGIKQSSEVVFVDSTGTLERLDCKVFVLLTNSFGGSLPLGIIITSVETEEAINVGLKMLQELVTESSFGGRGKEGPYFFMTDNSDLIRSALQDVFPHSHLLLCQFQVLQAMWRYIWNNNMGIHESHRTAIFHAFKSLVYEKNRDIFEEKMKRLFFDDTVLLYPLFVNHLNDIMELKEDWARCYRTHTMTRGRNTNNICENSTKIIREVIFSKAYSPVCLFTLLTTEFEQFYTEKLLSICKGCIPKPLEMKFYKLDSQSEGLMYDGSGEVVDTISGQAYNVEVEISSCSCSEGIEGKLCTHLMVALKNSEIETQLIIPTTEDERRRLFYIATGRNFEPDNELLKPPIGDHNYDENSLICLELEDEAEDEPVLMECDFDRLNTMFTNIKSIVMENPSLKPSMDTMIDSFERIHTPADLETAMYFFVLLDVYIRTFQTASNLDHF